MAMLNNQRVNCTIHYFGGLLIAYHVHFFPLLVANYHQLCLSILLYRLKLFFLCCC